VAAPEGDAGSGARQPAGEGTGGRQRLSGASDGAAGSRCCRAAPSKVLAPRINQAAINLLTRHGIEVVLVKDEQCCGALTHHLGQTAMRCARPRQHPRCGKAKRNKAASTPSW